MKGISKASKKMGKVFGLFSLALGIYSCNPDCQSSPSTNVFVPPGPFEAGTELAISSSPANFIQGRKLLISVDGTLGSDIQELDSRFEEDLGAAIVQIPEELTTNATILMDDPDCSGNLIPLGDATSLVDGSFFVDNPFFITPTPPLIIIPAPPINPPPAIVNAWFSPNNRDYCIWFNPTLDTLANGTVVEYPALIPAGSKRGIGPKKGSVELAVNCFGANDPADNRFYHDNPVSGIVDKENNFIHIFIDRTSKNLGIEEFNGKFINPEVLPEDYAIGGACQPDNKGRPNFMFLTSVQTGRQVILFRDLDK